MKNLKQRLGLRRDKPDNRDYRLCVIQPSITPIPEKIDYSSGMEIPRDQGPDGTCVAFACVHLKDYQERRERQDPSLLLSTRRVYDLCKAIDGLPGRGTYFRVALKILQDTGTCLESCCPYQPNGPVSPCSDWATQAAEYRILTYARIGNSPDEICRAIADTGPILAGVEVFQNWSNTTGHISMPHRGQRSIGGHAVCFTAYNRETKEFKFINSWSDKWGEKGYGYLPFAYTEKHGIDFWSIVDLVVPKPETPEQK